MEPIKLTGLQIVESKRMKQSGRRRLLIELTESDTKLYGAALTAWEDNELIFDSELKPSEVQGNDNGYERAIENPKEESIYVKFKRICIEYSGEAYYNKVKAHLNVEHVKDLEKRYDPVLVHNALAYQIFFIKQKMGEFSAITSSSSAYSLWEELFNSFNNP